MVLVHGAMDRGAGMAQLARHLRDAPTLRYDRRGYGRAIGLGPGRLVDHVDDLIAIVGTGPVILFGHSFGGLVVLAAAATGRLDVCGVATWEVPTPWIDGWSGRKLDDPGDVEDRPGEMAEAFMRRAVGVAAYDALPERTRATRRREGPALIADMDPILAAAAPFDPVRITVPCAFGAGDVSPIAYTIGAKWLAAKVADGRIGLIPGASHGAPTARPAAVAELIREVAARSHRWPGPGDTGGHDAVAV